jgi:putative ATP-dependent endonuclease of OLD family
MNCLIGPGDSTKTTILDAIDLALNPRSNYLGDDTDFHNLDFTAPATITVTLVGIPSEFCADNRYGLHLRGWNSATATLIDEPGETDTGFIDALSIRVELDPVTLEGRWSIFNDRLSGGDDPPSLRFTDARELATTRLGPYAERHLGWGRHSILNRIGDGARMTEQLAAASRAARDAFRLSNKDVFAIPTERAESLGKHFSVRVRKGLTAELDIQSASITAGGVTLHDGDLPLRTLGTGSSRLIVSALQHNARGSHIALVDEIEHGLEPHRIARLLKYLLVPPAIDTAPAGAAVAAPQIFLTTHSEVVLRELNAPNIHAVRCDEGDTKVRSVESTAEAGVAQRHLRSAPEAFLARRVLVGEGRTECGLLRGLDALWIATGSDSFALRGAVAIDGGGVPAAVTLTKHLQDLGYECLALLDSDEPPSLDAVTAAEAAGAVLLLWPDTCSTEERIFLDVPWSIVRDLIAYAASCHTAESITARINAQCAQAGLGALPDLSMPATLDTPAFRRLLGSTAKAKKKAWFKSIDHGEAIAAIVHPCLNQISTTPLAVGLQRVRDWIDG